MIEVYYEDIEKIDEENLIRTVVDTVLREENVIKKLDVYITLTNNENIQKINAEHRNIDKPTDVLSFPMFEREEIPNLKMAEDDSKEQEEMMLGDIIVSVEKVREQAEEYGHSFKRELAYLVTHGMLHLLGYDHMIDEEKVVMRKREEEILEILDIKRV
ncbi:MAG: rRNA maturation RNase YbeY [Clostridia bacterium]|nr:rRNA maturation RNase YbeY [Clostridia bacterium]MBQ8298846.1 rRNA maturation RNase YbeY [Clostridia bacterium]